MCAAAFLGVRQPRPRFPIPFDPKISTQQPLPSTLFITLTALQLSPVAPERGTRAKSAIAVQLMGGFKESLTLAPILFT